MQQRDLKRNVHKDAKPANFNIETALVLKILQRGVRIKAPDTNVY